jgi:hypothetical protein
MGGLAITETLIYLAPPILNLLGNLIKWLSEDTELAAAAKVSNGPGSRATMRRGVSFRSILESNKMLTFPF